MTALLESPVGTLDVSRLEERQPDVPLTCTDVGYVDGYNTLAPIARRREEKCPKRALWEGMCMGCGEVFRRCAEHYQEDAEWEYGHGYAFEHMACETPFYLAQYVRIGA